MRKALIFAAAAAVTVTEVRHVAAARHGHHQHNTVHSKPLHYYRTLTHPLQKAPLGQNPMWLTGSALLSRLTTSPSAKGTSARPEQVNPVSLPPHERRQSCPKRTNVVSHVDA